jgi:enoyl-CoA hydratase/carnithine racemase
MNAQTSAEEPALLVAQEADDVILITLNRPRARNAVSFEMWELFGHALARIENGSPPRALVLCGADNFFSTGGDIKIPPARGSGALAPATRLELGQRVIARLRALPVPVIAAIEGGAFGIGLSLALACDIVIASDTARFGAPFLPFGLVPDGGLAWFLTQRMGRQRASELIYTGRTFTAAEALDFGLLSRIVTAGQTRAEALAFAATVGQGIPHAVELTKRLLHSSEHGDLAACHALELVYCATCQTDKDLARARAAFASRPREGTAKA